MENSLYEKLNADQVQELKVGDTVYWKRPGDDNTEMEDWFIEEISSDRRTCVVRWNNPTSRNGVDEYFNEDALVVDLHMKAGTPIPQM